MAVRRRPGRAGMLALAGVFVAMVATTDALAGGDGCTKGSEFEPSLCPLLLPKITRIRVVENAIKSPALADPTRQRTPGENVDCSRFVLTPALVRRYLSRARQTNDRDAHFTLDWSACSARGQLSFADGRQGSWSIDQGRQARIAIGDTPPLALYCRHCAFGPFNRD